MSYDDDLADRADRARWDYQDTLARKEAEQALRVLLWGHRPVAIDYSPRGIVIDCSCRWDGTNFDEHLAEVIVTNYDVTAREG